MKKQTETILLKVKNNYYSNFNQCTKFSNATHSYCGMDQNIPNIMSHYIYHSKSWVLTYNLTFDIASDSPAFLYDELSKSNLTSSRAFATWHLGRPISAKKLDCFKKVIVTDLLKSRRGIGVSPFFSPDDFTDNPAIDNHYIEYMSENWPIPLLSPYFYSSFCHKPVMEVNTPH